MDRREFLKLSLATAGLVGLKFYSVPNFAIAGEVASKKNNKVICIFLRGGADVLSLFPPKITKDPTKYTEEWKKDYRNHPLYELRGQTEAICDAFLFGNAQFPFGNATPDLFALDIGQHPTMFHPAFSSMSNVINSNNFAVLLHTGSKSTSRSHFDQMDYIESGAKDKKLGTGYLARAASLIKDRDPLAIGKILPKSFNGADIPVISSKSELSFSKYAGSNRFYAGELTRDQRLELYSNIDINDLNCESNGYCKSVKSAQERYKQLESDLANYSSVSGSAFMEACDLAAEFTNQSSNPPIMTIDLGGWDHHFKEDPKISNSILSSKVKDLSDGLNLLNQKMSANTVVVVMSEFGRGVMVNPSRGTDHGRAGATIVMGKAIDKKQIYANKDVIKDWDLKTFEGTGESAALKVHIDIREVVAELLNKHLGVSLTENTNPTGAVQTVFHELTTYFDRGLIKV